MIYKKKLFFIHLTNYFGKIFIFYKKVVSLHSKNLNINHGKKT